MKKKNIIIVTWTGVYNFGTALQSYALQAYLETKGYNVDIFDKFDNSSWWRRIKRELKNKLLFKKKSRMNRFHSKYQNIIRPSSKQSLHKLINKTDVFISGSDQIWNTSHRYDPIMFLDFVEKKKKISFSTSIGTNAIGEGYKDIVKNHLLKYSHISVREKTAQKVLTELTGRKDIITVLDPTFMLNHEDWHKFGLDYKFTTKLPSSYILCYFVGKNDYYQNQLEDVIQKSKIKNIIILSMKGDSYIRVNDAIYIYGIGPNEFVHLIENATLICTDSFHATAISINFSKQFVEFLRFSEKDSLSQNSRIFDLLNHYTLSQYLYSKDDSWMRPINYDYVHHILQKDREMSWQYLESAIEK